MKRSLWFILTVALLVSCSQSEDFFKEAELTNSEISFFESFVTNSQRLTGEITNSTIVQNGNTFGVWGYKKLQGVGESETVFEGTTVTYSAPKWDYENHRFWDAQASYTFIATMPNDLEDGKNAVVSGDGQPVVWDHIPLSALVSNVSNKGGVDYLVAKQETIAKDATKGSVKFTFQHILSKLNVFAAATCNEDDHVKLTSLTLYLPNGTAKYEQKSASSPIPSKVFANDGDKWTWTLEPDPLIESPIQTEGIDLNNSKIYKKLANSYFVAPTETDLTLEQIDEGKGAQLKMDLTFEVSYKGGDTEVFSYKDLDVKDLHTFVQGYITNLYVNINLDAIQFGVDKVISFSNATVTDWTDSDDNFVDELGYSFNFKNVKTLASTEKGHTSIAEIDDYGNKTIATTGQNIVFSTFHSSVFSDEACTQKVKGTCSSRIVGTNIQVTHLTPNTTQNEIIYYVKVISNQGDSRVLAFKHEPASPILTQIDMKTEISSASAAEIVRDQPYSMFIAQLDNDKTARIILRDLTTGEEVNVITASDIGTRTTTAGNTSYSTIVSGLKLKNKIAFTPVSSHKYSIEIHCENDPLLFKYYELQSDGVKFAPTTKP